MNTPNDRHLKKARLFRLSDEAHAALLGLARARYGGNKTAAIEALILHGQFSPDVEDALARLEATERLPRLLVVERLLARCLGLDHARTTALSRAVLRAAKRGDVSTPRATVGRVRRPPPSGAGN